MSNLDVIKQSAAKGSINGCAVRRIVTSIAVIENPSKTQKWYMDLDTGVELKPNPHHDLVGFVRRNLCQTQWRAVRYDIHAVNPVSKRYEVIYLTLPLIDQSVSEYRGTFKAVHLDFGEANKTEQTPEQMIGLESGVINGAATRLFNIRGSEPMKPDPDGYNRRFADDDGVIRWNVETGEYCFTKSESCGQYLAPLANKQPDQIDIDDVLQGLDSAPESTMSDEVEALLARYRPTR